METKSECDIEHKLLRKRTQESSCMNNRLGEAKWLCFWAKSSRPKLSCNHNNSLESQVLGPTKPLLCQNQKWILQKHSIKNERIVWSAKMYLFSLGSAQFTRMLRDTECQLGALKVIDHHMDDHNTLFFVGLLTCQQLSINQWYLARARRISEIILLNTISVCVCPPHLFHHVDGYASQVKSTFVGLST